MDKLDKMIERQIKSLKKRNKQNSITDITVDQTLKEHILDIYLENSKLLNEVKSWDWDDKNTTLTREDRINIYTEVAKESLIKMLESIIEGLILLGCDGDEIYELFSREVGVLENTLLNYLKLEG